MLNILLIDDEPDCSEALAFFISKIGQYNILKKNNSASALNLLQKQRIDIIFSDVCLPGMDGLELTKIIKKQFKPTEIVLISGKQDIIDSINAIELGAYDFIPKPLDGQAIIKIVKELEKKLQGRIHDPHFDIHNYDDKTILELKNLFQFFDITANNISPYLFLSEASQNICKKLIKLSNINSIPVLLVGKTGSGKEVFARYFHSANLCCKNKRPFVALNCATISKELFEAELFGYEKGAFTGADPKGKDGKIKIAEGGTLFLDEITEIPIDYQSKLLRVLQEKEYYKVGGNIKQQVNTTIICATNKNIESLVKKSRFRKDLYYRLNICKIIIPSLKNRKEEIIPLTLLFIRELMKNHKIEIRGIEAKFLKDLYNYNWPGNIRELKNLITKLLIFHEGGILSSDTTSHLMQNTTSKSHKIDTLHFILPEKELDLDQYINRIISKTLEKFNGNKTKTAKYLKIPRKKLYYKYKLKPNINF